MVYLLGWGAIYYALLVSAMVGYRGRFLGFLTVLFFAGIAIFRGSVGTDTGNYELMLSELSLERVWGGVEPGFALLGLFLTELLGSAEAGVRALSALFFILVAFYYFRSDTNEAFFLWAYLAPAYFYQYSMNTLRIGLASMLLLVAVQGVRRSHVVRSGLIALVAMTFHYSLVFSISYLMINFFQKIKARYLLCVGLLFLLFFYLSHEYIILKMGVYSGFESPGSLSGLSKVIVVFLLVVGVLFSELPSILRSRVVFWAILISGFAVGVTAVSYAGLRLLDLIAFVLPVVILMCHTRMEKFFNWKTKLSFILAGLASAAAVYRGFLIEAGQGKSPFLPYELIIYELF